MTAHKEMFSERWGDCTIAKYGWHRGFLSAGRFENPDFDDVKRGSHSARVMTVTAPGAWRA
jgi:hypothetical protein